MDSAPTIRSPRVNACGRSNIKIVWYQCVLGFIGDVDSDARPASPFLAIGEPGVTVVGPSSGSPPLARSATQVTEDRDSPKSVLASLETTRFCHFVSDAPLGVVLEDDGKGSVVVKSVTPDGRAGVLSRPP